MQILSMSDSRIGLLGEKRLLPAPTLFVFSMTMQDSLENPHYAETANLLQSCGVLAVSQDLPCHGEEQREGEPFALDGWRARVEQNDNVVAEFTRKASTALDVLIAEGYTDPARVMACGTSRGGFLALHLAAVDPRIRAVAAYAPVTDLLALREFSGLEQHPLTNALALAHVADALAARAVWIGIGHADTRVGTDNAIALARAIAQAAMARELPANVELHVTPADGHTLPRGTHEQAVEWLCAQVGV